MDQIATDQAVTRYSDHDTAILRRWLLIHQAILTELRSQISVSR